MQLGKKRNHHINLTLRLGKQTYGDAHYNLNLGREWNLTTGYRYTYNDFNIYEKGERTYGISFNHHFGEVEFTNSTTTAPSSIASRTAHRQILPKKAT